MVSPSLVVVGRREVFRSSLLKTTDYLQIQHPKVLWASVSPISLRLGL